MGIVNAVQDGSVFACIVRGANFAITKQEIDNAEALMKEAELVILQMEIQQSINEYAIKKAKQCGCKVLLNAAPAEKMSEQSLKQCDIIVVNEVEAGFYLEKEIKDVEQAKEGAEKLAQKYNADIIITLGKAGSVVSEKGKIKFIPSKKVNAVETTGAGDSFIGGVGYALMQGKNLTEACEFATCCSAVTVCRPGAQPSMPTLDEVLFEK
ncbi:MAG: PfkB family carbohydrate kinase [Lachnospiraceae bacterium]